MAPFNKCSCCQVRTRKVIRDRATKKNIYVCPACFKSKKYLANSNKKKVQHEEEIAFENVDEKNSQDDVPENQENEVINELEKPLEKKGKLTESQKKKENKTPKNAQETSLNDLIEEVPQTSTSANSNGPPKITPPMMEIVVMNNRKYIAVSETADACNE
ncbi:uncharacterized protein LOC110188633 [Drosophila serrata]|uniref:uncharacterized protein LOC110188633 n=1 Tax=Drosophila serrata TaxID=7274 RepID=UPI000A1D0000|nr:uncharacterized protein LOC110188633 [Drosophila serrata]